MGAGPCCVIIRGRSFGVTINSLVYYKVGGASMLLLLALYIIRGGASLLLLLTLYVIRGKSFSYYY